ncbi:MAG: sulfatase [Planctomycetota bacterium]
MTRLGKTRQAINHLLFATVAASVFLCPGVGCAADSSSQRHPNVVVIFMDDMGYADIGPFGASAYPTPHLEDLASRGRCFTDFVVSSAVCSASRIALLTGCYHRRVGIRGALGPSSTIGIHAEETTLAEVCRSAGYRTACYGKWHLGHHPKFMPTEHGFDEFYGYPYSNDMWPLHPSNLQRKKKDPNATGPWPPLPLLESTTGSPPTVLKADVQPADQEGMTQELTKRSVAFIKRASDKPFFLYLPHPMVHVPLYVSEQFKGKSGAGLFGDVMMEIDWSVGQIIDAIESVGQTNNTLIVFTSDNGPWLSYGNHAGSAGPLREGKGTMWEGGYREPTVMCWPGTIPAGTTTDTLCSTIDLLPTLVEITGGDAPERKIDGSSMLSIMTGEPEATSPHESFAGYYAGGELQMVRDDRFKLVFPHRYRSLGDREPGRDGMPNGYQMVATKQALYDLDSDVSETMDVSEQYPEELARLQEAAEAYRDELGDKLQKRDGPGLREPGRLGPEDARLVW